MSAEKEKKDYCDAEDQKKVVEKMSECDKTSKTDKEKSECYSKVVDEDDGCMSS
ncbi:MAG: hypothetical protein KKE44_09500 [Proteobacteria bacterium]|nr:hypothetical protein [Pseudomonadota bacterium]MBU1582959.1 hypothetical protein [Pseudomonadota bacterium]MBU2631132.1 hypothetical protein [Pseudomonadota bacterium]